MFARVRTPLPARRLHPLPAVGVITYQPVTCEAIVDVLLIIGIILLILGILGYTPVLAGLSSIAWLLIVIAIIVIAWRIITGRRPV